MVEAQSAGWGHSQCNRQRDQACHPLHLPKCSENPGAQNTGYKSDRTEVRRVSDRLEKWLQRDRGTARRWNNRRIASRTPPSPKWNIWRAEPELAWKAGDEEEQEEKEVQDGGPGSTGGQRAKLLRPA